MVVSVAKEKRPDFVQLLEKLEPFEVAFLGTVTAGEIIIDNESWGTVTEWKDKYDNAIGNLLSKEEAGAALSTI